MPVTARLSHRLHDALGEDAGGDLVTWMQTVDAGRTELRELNELTVSRLESRIGEVRHELRADISELRAELRGSIAGHREETHSGIAELKVALAGVESKIDRRFAELLKWSFVFWCGMVAAVEVARSLR